MKGCGTFKFAPNITRTKIERLVRGGKYEMILLDRFSRSFASAFDDAPRTAASSPAVGFGPGFGHRGRHSGYGWVHGGAVVL